MQGWESRLFGCALFGSVEAPGIPVSGVCLLLAAVPAQPHGGGETGVRTSLNSTWGERGDAYLDHL